MIDLGTVRPGSTIRIPFSSFDKDDGSSITMTNFAVGDILVYKDGSTTERASTSGYTATTDFDSKTGKHLAVIDLADNTTSGFWNAGSEYLVAIDAVTVDAVTTGGWIARFRIGYPAAVLDTTIATLSSQTSFTLTAGPAEDDALNGMWAIIHDIASAVQFARVLILDYTGSTKTVTLAVGGTFTAAAGDNFSVIDMAPLQPATTGRTLVVDAAGLADANMVKAGPTGSGTAQTARDIGLALPAAAPNANGGLPILSSSGTTLGYTVTAVTTTATATNLTNLPTIPANWLTAAGLASDAVSEIQSGLATGTGIDQIRDSVADAQSSLDSIDSRIPASLSGGLMQATATIPFEQFVNNGIALDYGDVTASTATTVNFNPAVTGTSNPQKFIGCTVVVKDEDGTWRGQPRIVTNAAAGPGGTVTLTVDRAWVVNPTSAFPDVVRLFTWGVADVRAFSSDNTGIAGLSAIGLDYTNDSMLAANVEQLNGNAQSLLDLKDFADSGYDPATNKVQGVVLTDTVTTLTNLPAITTNWLTAAGIAADALNNKGNWLQPTTAGRKLTVTATGAAGIDWGNVENPGSSVELSDTIVASVLGAHVVGFDNNAITAAALASDAVSEIQSGLATAASIAALNNITAASVWAVGTRTLTSAANITSTGGTTVPQTGDSFARLGAPAGASVSADVAAVKSDTASLLTRITSTLFSGITSLAQWLGLIAGKQTGDATARTELRATGAGSGTFAETTDSLEAIRDRGDAAWTTATGFSTHSAADVWSVGTRTLTSGTNIVLAKGTGVTGFNDLSAAQVNAEADAALADVGLTTTVTGRIDAAVSSRMATYTQPTGFLAATFPATVASTTNITAASGVTISGTTTTLDALQTALNSAHGAGSWATATGFAVAGDAMTLTSGERAAVAAAWGARDIGDGRTADMFLQGLTNRIAFSADGLSYTLYATDDTTALATGTAARLTTSVGGLRSVDPE